MFKFFECIILEADIYNLDLKGIFYIKSSIFNFRNTIKYYTQFPSSEVSTDYYLKFDVDRLKLIEDNFCLLPPYQQKKIILWISKNKEVLLTICKDLRKLNKSESNYLISKLEKI